MQFITQFITQFAAGTCQPNGSFFGLPTWYKYLDGQNVTNFDPIHGGQITSCAVVINGIGDVWLIVAAVIDILLRVAILASIAFVLIGGVKFMTSQGQPDKIKSSLSTVMNALIGLVISVAAATAISYVAGRF